MQPVRQVAFAAVPAEPEEERNRRVSLLLDGLDLINQGVTVFDSGLKVVAANQRLATMFGLPRELVRPGANFADIIRYNAERGEYGPGDVDALVNERVQLALQFEAHHFERTRPDGTIITVTGAPISHGGWVTIYTDVTDLRSHERQLEEQVRARTLELQEANARLRRANDELRQANEEQKRLEAALVHAQRMEAVGALTGGLAHNFNNLLTIVISNLAALRDRVAPGSSTECVESALIAALKGADITGRLLAFARRQALEPRIVEINRVVSSLLALSRHSIPDAVRISRETAAGELHARVDAEQLEHALLNLVLNARDAMPRGGSLAVRSRHRQLDEADAAELQVAPGGYVELRVEDTGTGMDEATRSRVFEPFFTTKAGESGSGLGLSMVYGFAQQSEGAVHVASTPGMGTAVTLLLPLSPPPEPEAQQAFPGARPSASASAGRLVLLVEDNADVRTVLRRQLTEIGHMVIEAPNGEEALAIIDGVPDLAVLVSDIVMPGAMDGRRLAALARQRRPDLRIVLVTGYADGLDTLADRPFALLRKPCTKDELATAVGAAARS